MSWYMLYINGSQLGEIRPAPPPPSHLAIFENVRLSQPGQECYWHLVLEAGIHSTMPRSPSPRPTIPTPSPPPHLHIFIPLKMWIVLSCKTLENIVSIFYNMTDFCLLVLFFIQRAALKFPTIIVNSSLSPLVLLVLFHSFVSHYTKV